MIFRVPFFVPWFYKKLVWEMSTNVYLTFDDGPHPTITPWVLSLLEDYNMKATFFVIGDNVRKYPDVLQNIIDEGHSVGNHTYHHLKGWKTPTKKYIENIFQADKIINSPKPISFRPPYGRIKREQIRALKKENNRAIYMWSLLPHDYSSKLNIVKAKKALDSLRDGDIIVFHDSLKAEKNLKILLPYALDIIKMKKLTTQSLPSQ